MPSPPASHARAAVLLAVAALVSILLMVAEGERLEAAQAARDKVFSPFQRLFFLVEGYRGIQAENARLKGRLAELNIERTRFAGLAEENERLRRLLRFAEGSPHTLKPARVVGRTDSRVRLSLSIDVGTEDGIRSGMAVVTAEGLLGKITKAMRSTSKVLPLKDVDARVSVRVLPSRVTGILRWGGENTWVLSDIPRGSDVQVGDVVVTSGMGLLPADLVVGTVTRTVQLSGDVFMTVEVRVAADFNRLDHVFVMVE